MKLIQKTFLLTIIALLLGIIPFFPMSYTTDYKVEQFSNDLIYAPSSYNRSKSTILSIESFDEKNDNFDSIFHYYYYHQIVFGVRMILDGISVDEGATFYNIPTFSIRENEENEGGYYLDSGLFYTYYSSELLGKRGYLQVRNGCDSFVFISDKYADFLLAQYNISSYEELILNNKYNVITSISETGKKINFCINNIIYTNKRSAPRCAELYGDMFCLAPDTHNIVAENTKIRFEFDLKNSVFSISSVLDNLYSSGFDVNSYRYEFAKYSDSIEGYIFDDRLHTTYIDIRNERFNYVWVMLSIISCLPLILFAFYLFYFEKQHFINLFFFVMFSFGFLLLNLITNWFFLFTYFYLPILVFYILYLFLLGRRLKNESKIFVCLAKRKRIHFFFTQQKQIKI